MGKDHSPGDFGRSSGYKSDLEVAETQASTKSVKTSFGSKQHNAYVIRADGTHEHFYYSPKDGRSGWHGSNFPTHQNHPKMNTTEPTDKKGEKTMERSNSFLESLKVDKATVERCNAVSKNNAAKSTAQTVKKSGIDNGGRERGDSGPGSLGREAGNKAGNALAHNASKGGQGTGVQSAAGHNSAGGHSGSGGGHGGSGGGHGGSSGGHGGH